MTVRIGPKAAAIALAVMLQSISAIAMAQEVISLFPYTVDHFDIWPRPSYAYYNLKPDGDISEALGTARATDIGDWITPKVNMANYECRGTLLSGNATPNGGLNTWFPLHPLSGCGWWLEQHNVGQKVANLLVEIRRASDGLVLASAQVSLSVQIDCNWVCP